MWICAYESYVRAHERCGAECFLMYRIAAGTRADTRARAAWTGKGELGEARLTLAVLSTDPAQQPRRAVL